MDERVADRTAGSLPGGVLVTIAALFLLLGALRAEIPVDDTFRFPFSGPVAGWTAALLLPVGLLLVAFARRPGPEARAGTDVGAGIDGRTDADARAGVGRDIVGGSVLGRVALVGIGAVGLLESLVSALARGPLVAAAQSGTVLALLGVVTAVVAALVVQRAGVADRLTRRCLWVVAAVTAFRFLLDATSLLALVTPSVPLWTALDLLLPLALLALGVALVFDGRHARVRQRLAHIRSEW